MTDPVTTPEPWPAWLEDLDTPSVVAAITQAVADCHEDHGCGGSRREHRINPETEAEHLTAGEAERLLLRLLDEARQPAHYLSTSCFHGEHLYCQSGTGAAEGGETWAKVPASCKFCGAACRCGCHSGEPAPVPDAGPKVTLGILRARVSAALDAWNDREDGTEAADAVMAVVSPVIGLVWASREPQGGNPAAAVPSEPVMELLELACKMITAAASATEWPWRDHTWNAGQSRFEDGYRALVAEYAAAKAGKVAEAEPEPEPPVPDGEWARVEIMGHDSEYGWVTERTRAGVKVLVVSDWDGRVKAEIPGASLYKFVPLPTPQKRPEPQKAITGAGGTFGFAGLVDDDDDPDDYAAHAPGCSGEYCDGECIGARPF